MREDSELAAGIGGKESGHLADGRVAFQVLLSGAQQQ